MIVANSDYTQNAASPLVRRYPDGLVSGQRASDARYLRHAHMSSSWKVTLELDQSVGAKICAMPDKARGRATVDIKKLVLGQNVSMVSGCYGCTGKVVKVASDAVEVQISTAPSAVARWLG